MEGNSKLSKSKAYSVPIVIMIVMGVVLFLPAGSLRYWQGWIFWSVSSAMTLFITAYFFRRSPALLARRMQRKDQETVRKSPALLNLCLLIYFVPGFDFRFHWSTVPVWLVIAANAMVLLGYVLIIIVFRENSYASTVIQVEQDQQIISTGPYAIVRHPMYTGLLVMQLCTPLALGSYWAIIPALLYIPWFAVRITNEEELLMRDLPGYKEYCQKTPYRLIPSVW